MQTPRPTAARGWKLEQTTQQAPPCMFWQQRHSRLQGLTSPKPGTPRDEGCFCINKIFRGKKKSNLLSTGKKKERFPAAFRISKREGPNWEDRPRFGGGISRKREINHRRLMAAFQHKSEVISSLRGRKSSKISENEAKAAQNVFFYTRPLPQRCEPCGFLFFSQRRQLRPGATDHRPPRFLPLANNAGSRTQS